MSLEKIGDSSLLVENISDKTVCFCFLVGFNVTELYQKDTFQYFLDKKKGQVLV